MIQCTLLTPGAITNPQGEGTNLVVTEDHSYINHPYRVLQLIISQHRFQRNIYYNLYNIH